MFLIQYISNFKISNFKMILVICGLKGSGKDTIGDYLIQNYNFKRFHFGDALKDVCSILFGWTRKLLEGDTKESRIFRETEDIWWSKKLGFKITPRIAFQKIGTDVIRKHFHMDIWTLIIERRISEFQNKHNTQNIVITDCRFQNEIQMVRSYGAKLISVYRNLPEWFIPYKKGEISAPENVHVSEYDWIRTEFDFEIKNEGTYKNLYETIELYYQSLKKKYEK
jgi:hypothetical protein